MPLAADISSDSIAAQADLVLSCNANNGVAQRSKKLNKMYGRALALTKDLLARIGTSNSISRSVRPGSRDRRENLTTDRAQGENVNP